MIFQGHCLPFGLVPAFSDELKHPGSGRLIWVVITISMVSSHSSPAWEKTFEKVSTTLLERQG